VKPLPHRNNLTSRFIRPFENEVQDVVDLLNFLGRKLETAVYSYVS